MNEDVKKKIEQRLSGYGLTLDDFSKREIREMVEEIELDQAHKRGERLNEYQLDGMFVPHILNSRALDKEMKAYADKDR